MAETNQLLINYYKKEETKKVKKMMGEKLEVGEILENVNMEWISKEEVLNILGEDYQPVIKESKMANKDKSKNVLNTPSVIQNTPMEIAEKYKKYFEEYNQNRKEICKDKNISNGTFQKYLRLNYLIPELQGYIIDKKRMENGIFFDEDYFKSLLAEIREIRLSERRFYQKITDIYATSIDYDSKSPITINFFLKVQNKMHYAVTHQTAAEIIYNRSDHTKEHMNLTNWKNSPNGKILENDVVIAKNYLKKGELEQLELIVSAFLDLAEARAKRNIPMTMEDWANRIDKYLLSDDRDVLKDAGKISHEIAKEKGLTEFEKYRVIQDKLYKSDFDKLIESSKNK